MPIQDVSDTALLTAYARAVEYERPDALFHDQHALELAGDRGRTLALASPAFSNLADAISCRTAVFDELLLEILEHQSIDLVVNIAAGFDARPWRLPLPRTLRWIDVDSAPVLNRKQAHLKPAKARCIYSACAADIGVVGQWAAVCDRFGSVQNILALTEGLLVYLCEDEVARLASELHRRASVNWWITDLAGSRALPMMRHAWGSLLEGTPLQFAPKDAPAFFRQCGWREKEFRSSQEQARVLGRGPPQRWFHRTVNAVIPAPMRDELRRLTGVAVLQRFPPAEGVDVETRLASS